ncbi:MAG TPA: hypothetical protein VMR70_07295 [Flavisolibacter sp.]|nr:hypothetical protein [Flavisolibacter sp.]
MHQTIAMPFFNSLADPSKYAALEDYGIYLGVYQQKDSHKIALFAVHDFYVEVWVNPLTNQLYKAVAFGYEGLDPFLQAIDISDVYCQQ